MKLLILLVLVGFVACQKGKNPPAPKAGAAKPAARSAAPKAAAKPAAKSKSPASGGDKKYVWDFLKPALDAAEVAELLKSGADAYLTLAEVPADNAFDCGSKKQPGFYADTTAKCQVFHRCDVNGNKTSYLCVNSTLFNQITLTCDYFFNVDCEKFAEQEDFANSRLYKEDQPLFDTPPDDYVPPQREPRKMGEGETGNEVSPAKTTKKGGATTKAATKATTKKGGATAKATTASPEETTAAAGDEETTGAAGGKDTTAAGGEDTTAAAGGEETTAAGGEDTTAAASGEETTAAAGGEETTAAGGKGKTTKKGGATTKATTKKGGATTKKGGVTTKKGDATTKSTTAAPEETTAAAGGEETTAAVGGEETTAAAGGEETTAAAGGEATTAVAA